MAATRIRASARQTATIIVTLVGLLVLTFCIGRLMPVDPVRAIVGEEADNATYRDGSRTAWHGKPVHAQFLRYIGDIARGDFGISIRTGQPVIKDIARVMPATIELATTAILCGAGLGIPLGILAAVDRNRPSDHVIRFVTLIGHSMPIFWTGMVALIVFYADARLGRRRRTRVRLLYRPRAGDAPASCSSTLRSPATGRCFGTPSITSSSRPASLAIRRLAYITRMTRSFMLDQLEQEYITTARVKGLSSARTIWRHAFANIRVQLVTIVALAYGRLLEGAVLIETVFSWPGFGQYMTNNMLIGDMNAVMTCVLMVGIIFIGLNLLSDPLYKIFDPRTR